VKLTRTAVTQAALVIPTLAAEVGFALEYASLMMRATLDANVKRALIAGGCALLIVPLVFSVMSLWQTRRWPRGTRGRVRLITASTAATINLAAAAAATAVLWRSESAPLLQNGIALGLAPDQMVPLAIASATALVSMLAWLGAASATWFLLSERTRARLWRVIDVFVLFGGVAAVALLPTQPPRSDPNALQLPIIRHVITTIAVLRLTVRVLPVLMDGIEALSFQALIAARHLRAKKSGFLAVISILAVLAVTVSSCSLVTTLSVMGGFRNDLKRKILGANAHVVIDRDNRTIDRWESVLDSARKTEGVIGAAPYVSGEVMLSSSSNLATAVLRGIDPEHIGEVSDLPNNIRTGKLEYLVSPEKLLNLPPEVMGKMMMTIDDDLLGSQVNGSDLGPPSKQPSEPPVTKPTPKSDSVRDALAGFLIEDKADAVTKGKRPAAKTALPGIIIGQELARSLRLYLGDEVNVVAPLGALGPAGPMPKSRPFRVAGIFFSGMYEYDMKYTYVTLPTAQRFLNTGDAIHGIEIKAQDAERAPTIASLLRKALSDREVRVRDWQELNSRLFGALALEKLAMFIALGIAILVASFCIAATLMLMVQEKGRQIAVLKAIGSPDSAIVRVFVLEGLMIGAFGSSLGLFLGYMVCFAFEHFGIRMNPEVYYIDKLPVHIEPSEFVLVGIASVLVCLLVTIYPAVLGSRLRPVDALRYE